MRWASTAASVQYLDPTTADAQGHWAVTRTLDFNYTVDVSDNTAGAEAPQIVLSSKDAVGAAPTLEGPSAAPAFTTIPLVLTANPDSTVVLHFHKAGTPAYDYSIVREVTVSGAADVVRPVILDTDYRVYATAKVGGAASPTILVVGTPTVTNPAKTTVARGGAFTITGRATANSTVLVRYHRAGTAADDYSIVRPVTASPTGTWSRTATLDVDYRAYATTGSGAYPTQTVLFAAPPPPEFGAVKDGYLPQDATTVGIQLVTLNTAARSTNPSITPGAGMKFVSIKACGRNRGPNLWRANGGYFVLGSTSGDFYGSDADISGNLADGPIFYQENVGVGQLFCGWAAFRVPTTAVIDHAFFVLGDGDNADSLVWRTR